MNINIDCYKLQTAMNDWLAERREALVNVIKNQLQTPPGLFTLSIDRSLN
jgi:hypothetical protein